MIFVELTPFAAFRERYLSDDEFAALERLLVMMPDAGVLLPASGGLRKVRWSVEGRGKRGGARVIYYWHGPANCIYLLYGYTKSHREDLTNKQLKQLRNLLRDTIDG